MKGSKVKIDNKKVVISENIVSSLKLPQDLNALLKTIYMKIVIFVHQTSFIIQDRKEYTY